MKKAFIIGGVVIIGGYIGLRIWNKEPTVVININLKTGNGYATVGNKRGEFDRLSAVVLPSWNGYRLSVGGDGKYAFTRFGKNIESGTITEYDGGSSTVTINHI